MTAKTRKVRRPCRKTRRRGDLSLTRANADIYYGGYLQQKKAFVRISEGYLYIFRDNGSRSYWVLHRIDESERPEITFNDTTQSFRVGKNRVVIHGCTDYQRAKAMLEPYSRPSHI